jgi:large subunit ribosomal protein L6
MSRIGRLPVKVPAGVTIQIDGNTVTVNGPKGQLQRAFSSEMTIRVDGDAIVVERPSDLPKHKATHGLTRTLISNMVTGVSKGFEKSLELVGVGYRASKSGQKLVLNVGYSHPVEMDPPTGIDFEVPSQSSIIIRGADREKVGQVAANVRKVRPPEPYKGKGIRYVGEYVRRKVGKAGKK